MLGIVARLFPPNLLLALVRRLAVVLWQQRISLARVAACHLPCHLGLRLRVLGLHNGRRQQRPRARRVLCRQLLGQGAFAVGSHLVHARAVRPGGSRRSVRRRATLGIVHGLARAVRLPVVHRGGHGGHVPGVALFASRAARRLGGVLEHVGRQRGRGLVRHHRRRVAHAIEQLLLPPPVSRKAPAGREDLRGAGQTHGAR